MNTKEMLVQFRDRADAVYVNSLQRTYFRMFGHPIDQRFAIVGHARTGSNYLLDGLRTSPSVRMYHEIFADHNRQIGKDFDRVFATVFQPESRLTRIVGFKVFYNHLTEEEWNRLLACRELKIIHLTRRNRLRTVISLEIAFKTGQWTNSGNSDSLNERRIMLDPRKLVKRLEQVEEGEATARSRFDDRQVLEVVYEELVRSPKAVFELVSKYLGLDGIDYGKIKLRRQNPETLQQLIVNYDEVKLVLEDTRFADCLDS